MLTKTLQKRIAGRPYAIFEFYDRKRWQGEIYAVEWKDYGCSRRLDWHITGYMRNGDKFSFSSCDGYDITLVKEFPAEAVC